MKYKQNLRIDGNKVYSYNTHVATINRANRTLTVHGYWSVTTSKHVNHVADQLGLKKVDGDAPAKETSGNGDSMLKTVAMVAKLGAIFAPAQKENNDWQLRMLKAGLSNRGLSVPENWEQLSEDEKARRLQAAVQAIN